VNLTIFLSGNPGPLSAAPRHPWDRLPARLAMGPAALLILAAITVSFIDERRRLKSKIPV